MTEPETVGFYARDGYALKAQLFRPEGRAKGGVLISSGTGFKARYYEKFARALGERGFLALAYDCRGIGRSAPDDLADLEMRYWDWGQKDMPGALDFLEQEADGLPLLHVGHSVGGHFVGFWDNHAKVRAHAFVCVGSGYVGDRPVWRNPSELAFWRIIGPRSIKKHGYVKSGRLWTGASLPRGVFEDWKRWCHTEGYYGPDLSGPLKPHHFEDVTAPITSFVYTDDAIANPTSAAVMLDYYPNAESEVRISKPSDYGLKSIGHGGPFADKHEPARNVLLDWCDDRVG